MKDTSTKGAAIFAMIISLISFGLMICSFIALITEPASDQGDVSKSFAFWVFGMIVAYFSLIFYFIDAILSAIKVFMKIHPIFNTILSTLLLGAIPMGIFVGGGLGISIYIWNAYYLAIFILEIVSIVKHVKMNALGDVPKSDSQTTPFEFKS